MPLHKHVTACLRGGPLSDRCSCPHCTLRVCGICGAYEGSLTTDCPGAKISFDRQQEIYETPLDYTDTRGWHQGEPTKRRSPRFEPTTASPPRAKSLEHYERELARKAVMWVRADRVADDQEAALSSVDKEVDEHFRSHPAPTNDREELGRLQNKHEAAKAGFKLADQRAVKCDEEFRQAARALADALEHEGVLP